MSADLGAVTAAAQAYGDQRAADQKVLDDAKYAALQADFDIYKKANPAPQPVSTFVVGGAFGGNLDPNPLEARAGKKFGSRRTYHASVVSSVLTTIQANIAAGRRESHVSMQPAVAWASIADGSQDAWLKDIATRIAAKIAGTGHVVRFTLRHEPEGKGPAADWTAMQAHAAPFFNLPGILFTPVLMGYHSFSKSSPLYAQWNLDACMPTIPEIKGVGYDLYENYGSKGSTSWTNWDNYFSQIATWHKAHNIAWGLSETGCSPAAFTKNPQWFDAIVAKVKSYGGSWFDYFNTNLNSVAEWEFSPEADKNKVLKGGDPREAAFSKLL